MKSRILQCLQAAPVVAIMRLDDLSSAVPLSLALARGGVLAQEFTLTNPDALRVVRSVKNNLHAQGIDAAIGIGSVRTRDEAHQALDAAADFIVSPITRADIIEACRSAGVAIMPGAYTPTEIAHAWDSGADIVKVFPARGLGPGYIKDVLAPMPYLKLMPTGGIDLNNMAAFFAAGAVAVGVGGNLINAQSIRNQDWDAVTSIARQYCEAARHV